MAGRAKPILRVFPDLESLSRAAALAMAERINATVEQRGRFTLVLSGGHTPKRLYELLGSEYLGRIPWPDVHLFWGDERYIPATDSRSNFAMVRRALLDSGRIPTQNVHPIATEFSDPVEAARAYERELKIFFRGDWPEFDLVLLGLGLEGHTASLFPDSPALAESRRWVVPVQAPVEPRGRITMTLPVLNRAVLVYFLVAGADKAAPLERALAGPSDPDGCPASAVRPERGEVVWWVDQSAAALAQGHPGATTDG